MRDRLANRMQTALLGKGGVVRAGEHDAGQRFAIRQVDAGKLLLPTGRICVADAFMADEFPPMNRIVPPGEYPVEIVIPQLPRNLAFGNHRAAFLIVRFSSQAPRLWEPATSLKAADPCFKDNDANGFVQEGASAVFSPEAGAVHFAHLREQFDEQKKRIEKLERGEGMYRWCNFRPGDDAANVVTCEGGFGDGTYHCFARLDVAGRVTHLIIDFGIAGP